MNDAEKQVALLARLIATPSFSGDEKATAEIIAAFFADHSIETQRLNNNVWARNKYYDAAKPTILLNSHHDTVNPNSAYTRDPFAPTIEDGKLYGLGSNDAGASVVSLMAAFLHFYGHKDLKYNLIIAITGEEEKSGHNGLESVIPHLGKLDFAIVGEPTLMQLAIAERGLIVLDCIAHGRAGHAAREEGDNAIYKAMKDVEWFRTYKFPLKSDLFGEVKMSVTVINAGTQHNVVPADCRFTVDIRVTDKYTNPEIVEFITKSVDCEVIARSTRLRPSSIDPSHPIVRAGVALGLKTYGSPTSSDQTILDIPSVKIGVGNSARSHSADEFVYIHEIEEGINLYIKLLESIL